MGIRKYTIVNVVCDECETAVRVGSQFLSIGDHGLTFHTTCFTRLTPGQLMHHMGHDESVVHTINDNGELQEESIRLRDPRALQDDGRIDRKFSTETVTGWSV